MPDFYRNTISEERENLRKLHRWLTYELSSVGLGGLVLFVAYRYIVQLLALAVILFTPYMLWRLFKARRYGWIAGFIVTVGLPFLYSRLADPADMVVGFMLSTFPLVAFYSYTWLLRYSVGEWLLEAHYWTETPA